jgi:aspartate/methionine/tyrosine aminotransferase
VSIKPFKLERYFARYEFNTKYLLSSSDCESLLLSELLEMASPESLAQWQNLKLGYTESDGHPLLRTVVSNSYAQINAENVLIAVPEEAIFIAMHTLLRPGDHVIAISPTYQSLHEIAFSIGCNLTFWKLEPDLQGWKLDLNKLEDILTDQTRLLVLNFPNNPTGFIPTRQQFDAIINLAQKHGVIIFCDEMYRFLESDPALRLPSICDIYEKGIALSGLSKSFALPGLRLGWLATRQSEFLADCISYKDYTTICNSAPSEILAIIALQNSERIVARNIEIIRGNISLAEQFFGKHSGVAAWISPQAGSIAFPNWLGPGTVEEFCRDVLEKHNIMIVPGSLFDYPGNHFRIGLGRKNFYQGLEHLDDYLSKNPKAN